MTSQGRGLKQFISKAVIWPSWIETIPRVWTAWSQGEWPQFLPCDQEWLHPDIRDRWEFVKMTNMTWNVDSDLHLYCCQNVKMFQNFFDILYLLTNCYNNNLLLLQHLEKKFNKIHQSPRSISKESITCRYFQLYLFFSPSHSFTHTHTNEEWMSEYTVETMKKKKLIF